MKKNTYIDKKTSSYQLGGGNIVVGEWEVKTIGYKIGSKIYVTTWGIQPIFFNNFR